MLIVGKMAGSARGSDRNTEKEKAHQKDAPDFRMQGCSLR
jgi:hypothetical protein